MATNASIGIVYPDGSVLGTTVTRNGHTIGEILATHYTTPSRVEKLLSFGAISSLGVDIAPEFPEFHTFANPEPGVTVFYGRDRQEEDTHSLLHDSIYDFIHFHQNNFNYIFEYGGWWQAGYVPSGIEGIETLKLEAL